MICFYGDSYVNKTFIVLKAFSLAHSEHPKINAQTECVLRRNAQLQDNGSKQHTNSLTAFQVQARSSEI